VCSSDLTRVLDQVARAALAVGADYVDAAGDDPVHAALTAGPIPPGRTAVLSAGTLPGLSALLPRALAATGTEHPRRLVAYLGGLERFTPAAAEDYLSSLDNGFGEAAASWRDGAVASRSLTPLPDAELPFFPHRVTAHPFLSTEARRLAVHLGLDELCWYHVFAGSHFLRALVRVRSAPAAADGVAELVAAAAADIAGRACYQVFVFRLEGLHTTRTLVLRTRDSYRLTGQVAALASTAVLTGQVPAGVHFTADVLDPAATLDRVRLLDAVDAVEVLDTPWREEMIEEGAL